MRDCHPDTSSAEESTEFATFLNEIYEVRMLVCLLGHQCCWRVRLCQKILCTVMVTSVKAALRLLQTLMDDGKRADYDSLIGFSRLAVNPFDDTTFERDQVWSLTALVPTFALSQGLQLHCKCTQHPIQLWFGYRYQAMLMSQVPICFTLQGSTILPSSQTGVCGRDHLHRMHQLRRGLPQDLPHAVGRTRPREGCAPRRGR